MVGGSCLCFSASSSLMNPGDARRRQAVADVALHRAERAVAACFCVYVPEGLLQPLHLDRIAQLRARAVRLDQLDVRRIDAEPLVDLLLQARLRFAGWAR